jgi:DNA adenine methylase
LLRKAPSTIEVFNDINGEVVNFFRVLRERPAELVAAIDLTPYSREEHALAQESSSDPLERARRFYVWSWQGRGRAGVREPGGWRFMKNDTRSKTPVDDWNNYGHLWAVVRRLKEVQIENDDALKTIARFDTPDSLFYIDPPYVQDTRCFRWKKDGYLYDYPDDKHRELAGALRQIQGMAIISGYPSDLYQELYPDWKQVSRPASKDNGVKEAMECLWLSPNTLARASQKSLF